jgi:hypothetical protein
MLRRLQTKSVSFGKWEIAFLEQANQRTSNCRPRRRDCRKFAPQNRLNDSGIRSVVLRSVASSVAPISTFQFIVVEGPVR